MAFGVKKSALAECAIFSCGAGLVGLIGLMRINQSPPSIAGAFRWSSITGFVQRLPRRPLRCAPRLAFPRARRAWALETNKRPHP